MKIFIYLKIHFSQSIGLPRNNLVCRHSFRFGCVVSILCEIHFVGILFSAVFSLHLSLSRSIPSVYLPKCQSHFVPMDSINFCVTSLLTELA